MGQSLEQPSHSQFDYVVVVKGGEEHGTFDITPPTNDQHYAALMEEPRLSRPSDFSLEREATKDTFWLGSEYSNGSGYGEHYRRACYFARVVSQVLLTKGASVDVVTDTEFERRSNARLASIQQANATY